ncbi:MAG: WD40 repeat domain-containing protein [Nostoc sp. ChiQUE02]|uniref:NACHT and WD repeat domain-containing protein n=1 Tax=Nostoc sp. ChiQUE02 TaxID=3075377 RepID=UPI002AD4F043|nr:WD40 repeat domain-containing protein [Nostoc sp. ChiQUE02]MDZ8229264.1 WD40 repeat domain-containing protein [Nostoc sp. ChiQUE02]
MDEVPYLGLNPFSEKDAPFFFGRDEQKRAIARNLRVSRLTVLLGESGVGKSSILQAGVVPQFHRDVEQNRQEHDGKPQWAVVVFNAWHSDNPLELVVNEIRNSVAAALKIDPTSLKDEATITESLQTWTEMLSGEPQRGQIFIILDQFEEYFQYHSQESGEGTFADEFPRWVNHPSLSINFLIAMRQDALAKLNHFQGRIINIFDNQLLLQRLDRLSARDAIVKPIGQYNLQQIITNHLMTSRLTLLSTASMEKSRILKYGIAHRLQQIAQQNLHNQGIAQIATVIFHSWRGNPVVNLKQQLAREITTLFPNIQVPQVGASLAQTLQEWAEHIGGKQGKGKLFIILDQFEEYFQYQQPDMGEGSFVAEFAHAVNSSELPVHFLIAIRDEELSLLKYFEQRIPGIFDNPLQIKQLEEDSEIADLVKPIEEPSDQTSQAIAIEPELVEEVLNQVQVGMVSLIETDQGRISIPSTSQGNVEIEAPFLELVMERLWKEEIGKKGSRCLRLETLNQFSIPEKNITGAQRIANEHLSEQMNILSDRERNAMATVFKYLVSAGGTKIAYPLLDLPETTGLNEGELISVLDKLDRQRILRTVKAPNHLDIKRYEIFHDIIALPILKWRDRYLLEKRLKEEKEKGKQKAEKQIRRGSLIGGEIVLFSIIMSALFFHVSNHIHQLLVVKTKIEQALDTYNPQSSRPSGQIVGLINTIQAGNRFSTLLKNPLLTWNPFLAPSIKEYKNNSIQVLQTILNNIHEKNNLILHPMPQSDMYSLSFSLDRKLIATGFADGTVRLWTLQGQQKNQFPVPGGRVLSLSFSPDGKLLATSSDDGIVRLWTLHGQQKNQFQVPGNKVLSLNFSPDGKLLATGSVDGTVRLWTIQGEKQEEFQVSQDPVYSLSFSPDGKLLATGSQSGAVRLWDFQNLQPPKALLTLPNLGSVWSLSFSPDGKLLATGFVDDTVRLWTIQGEKQEEFPGYIGRMPVLSISFNPHQNILIAGYDKGIVRFWDISGEKQQVSDNLDNLVASGCDWLQDYLATHPDAKKNLSFCQPK